MATDAEVIRTLKDRRVLLFQAISRSLQLHEESERLTKKVEELKKQLASRRHQADVWRKKFNKLSAERIKEPQE